MSEFDFVKKMQDDIPEDVRIYVKKSMDILDRLHELMEQQGIMQKELAERMGKSEAEVSKWLNGVQNFTLKSLSKLEAALGASIIEVPCKRNRLQKLLTIKVYRGEAKPHYLSEFKKLETPKNSNGSDHATAA